MLNQRLSVWAANLMIRPIITNQNQKKDNKAVINGVSLINWMIVLILVLSTAKIYPKIGFLFDYFFGLAYISKV
ncbi:MULTISPECIES: hypothetical protein [unclassified Pedobacter]|uniref:hypothetical protein n=1 Tax=unclassified Pedobacter TaxID=2628915 RepID=UPI00141EDC2A|nr:MULTISPECIES: hypothetical protein [unclassified Pedobacter]NII82367.1 hypothetical protein [Pedobacter sp. SG908]NMN36393.1 hypothetical protein [Pedobacter sp. SG918]